jgi:hypothetical protein
MVWDNAMNDFEQMAGELVSDSKRLESLLMLEKERRGVSQETLVFVGMHNVAQHWWCTQQAVLKSRANELGFFAAYLSDRIVYAHRLGLVTKLPKSPKALLGVGNDIALEDVEKLLKEEAAQLEDRVKLLASSQVTWLYQDMEEKDGKRTRLINPDLPPAQKVAYAQIAEKEGRRVIDLENDPKLRGKIYQSLRAERYPTIRWHFPWDRYSVVGVPDGITKDCVYEFKTTNRLFYLGESKPIAFAQADLYGLFFRRPNKRVQIYVVEKDATKTWEEPVDAINAEATLAAFARVDAGEPAPPPRAWKCRLCEFRVTCPISQLP